MILYMQAFGHVHLKVKYKYSAWKYKYITWKYIYIYLLIYLLAKPLGATC